MTDDAVKQAYNETHSAYVPPTTLVATHWIPLGVAFEDSDEFPDKSPVVAAKTFIHSDDLFAPSDDARNDLEEHGEVVVELCGCYETTELIHNEDEPFDGYEPGCTYWKRTDERKRVRITLTAVEIP
jgi:hypothetical protein